MGFEDLIKNTSTTKTNNNFNATNHCPHCRTRHILTYLVQGIIGGERRQKAHCPSCNKWWYIVYEVDLRTSTAYIELIDNKPSVLGRP